MLMYTDDTILVTLTLIAAICIRSVLSLIWRANMAVELALEE